METDFNLAMGMARNLNAPHWLIEDIAQEALIYAWLADEKIQDARDPKAFRNTVMKNRIRTVSRCENWMGGEWKPGYRDAVKFRVPIKDFDDNEDRALLDWLTNGEAVMVASEEQEFAEFAAGEVRDAVGRLSAKGQEYCRRRFWLREPYSRIRHLANEWRFKAKPQLTQELEHLREMRD